jgi:hypothetical protein
MFHSKRLFLCVACIGLLAGANAWAASVYFSVSSPQNGLTVAPGDTITWTINFSVSSSGNRGLSFIAIDLKQNQLNPEKIVIPSATSAASAMAGFIAPAGISSHGDGGYYGTPVGTECYADLYCIGGAQNTTGVTGSEMGTDTTVETNVGKNGALVLASGTFVVPETMGIYTFQISNGAANVLSSTQGTTPPWACVAANVAYTEDAISFYFEVACLGDTNGDNNVNQDDLANVLGSYGLCLGESGYNPIADLNGDDCVNFSDLSIIMAHYGITCNE